MLHGTEVIYAAESRKEIIPLTVEPRYKPHGWLKFHMSDKLRLDFSSDTVFNESMKKLISGLRKIFSSLTSEFLNASVCVSARLDYKRRIADWWCNTVDRWCNTVLFTCVI